MNKKKALPILLIGLFLSGCNDPASVAGAKSGQRLHEAGEIAAEILKAHNIKGHPYYKLEDEVSRIELNLEDPDFDHQSLATELTKLKSIQSFDGNLQLVFIHRDAQDESKKPLLWIKYDSKTGKKLEQ